MKAELVGSSERATTAVVDVMWYVWMLAALVIGYSCKCYIKIKNMRFLINHVFVCHIQ